MLRILGIQHPHRLPPSLALAHIAPLERKAGNQHRQRQPLRVHPRLHQLLLARERGVAPHERKRDDHAGGPGAEDDGVPVLRDPFFGAHGQGLQGFALRGGDFGGVAEVGVGVAPLFEGAGVAVGGDDGWDCEERS